jgi:mRNA interferase RelE/StbE
MASYKVEIKKSAQKEIRKLPKGIREKVVEKIDKLAADPLPSDTEKIKGLESAYRIRQGSYRIVYYVFKSVLLVSVIRVRDRKEVYRDL